MKAGLLGYSGMMSAPWPGIPDIPLPMHRFCVQEWSFSHVWLPWSSFVTCLQCSFTRGFFSSISDGAFNLCLTLISRCW